MPWKVPDNDLKVDGEKLVIENLGKQMSELLRRKKRPCLCRIASWQS